MINYRLIYAVEDRYYDTYNRCLNNDQKMNAEPILRSCNRYTFGDDMCYYEKPEEIQAYIKRMKARFMVKDFKQFVVEMLIGLECAYWYFIYTNQIDMANECAYSRSEIMELVYNNEELDYDTVRALHNIID